VEGEGRRPRRRVVISHNGSPLAHSLRGSRRCTTAHDAHESFLRIQHIAMKHKALCEIERPYAHSAATRSPAFATLQAANLNSGILP
jgi:hypothetical protein